MSNYEQYCYYLYSPGLYHTPAPIFYHRDNLPKEGFASVYAVTRDTAKTIIEAGTTKGFKGIVWSPEITLDFDTYESGQRAEVTLKEMGYAFDVYDTGGRGLHVTINRDCNASHFLPVLDRDWVRKLFPEADLSPYTHLHLFRLTGTTHNTGRVKSLVRSHPGEALNLRDYKIKEETKRESSLQSEGASEASIFFNHQIMCLSHPVKEGDRHRTLVQLVYKLKEQGLSIDAAEWWVGQVNAGYLLPKAKEELEKIVKSIYE